MRADPAIGAHLAGARKQKRARESLDQGLWCWPAEERARRALSSALDVPLPTPRSGVAAVISVTFGAEQATLWRLSWEQGSGDVELARSALSAWSAAGAALHRSASILWTALDDVLSKGPPRARPVRRVALKPNRASPVETHLEGESYGLAFGLLQASVALDIALPHDLVATGAVDETGAVHSVAAVAEKVIGLGFGAPGVRRVLVPHCDVDAARRGVALLQEAGVDAPAVIGVSTLREALNEAWGDQLERALVGVGNNTEKREQIIDELFHVHIDRGWAAIRDFRPFLRAVELILETWPELTEAEKRQLEVARAIAQRHIDNRGEIPVPTTADLAALPAPERLRWLAQTVQQSSDTGQLSLDEVDGLVAPHLVRGADAFVEHLELQGAVARLYAVNGREREALELSEECARGFLARRAITAVSHPLCLWYRLAEALHDDQAFEEAERVNAKLRVLNGPSSDRSFWVRLARAVALAGLRRDRPARQALEQLGADEQLPPHVRATAFRWRVVAAARDGELQDARVAFQVLQDLAEAERRGAIARQSYRIASCILSLHEELPADLCVMPPEQALREVEQQDPGVVLQLMRAGHSAAAEHVKRFYPYA